MNERDLASESQVWLIFEADHKCKFGVSVLQLHITCKLKYFVLNSISYQLLVEATCHDNIFSHCLTFYKQPIELS